MAEPLAVLIVEDSESDAQLLLRLLKKAGYKVAYEQVDTSEGMCAALDKRPWDIVISDYSMPRFDGPTALKLLKDKGLDIPFIVVSGTIGEEIAVAMMKSGAHDYLVKGDLARLVPAVERELEQARVRHENKQKEAEIQAADKRFRALIENSADAITLLDARGRVIYDSPSAPGLLGYGPKDWIDKDVFQLMHPDDLQKNRDLLRDVLENPGVRVDSNFRLRKKDGSWLWIEGTAKNLLDEPSVNAIVMNYRDITPRMEAEETIALSEARYRSLVENQAEVVSRSDLSGNLNFVNDSYCRVFGVKREQVLGSNFESTIFPEDLPLVRATQEAIKHPPYRKYIEIRSLTSDGIRWFGWETSAVYDELGKVVELQGVGRDINERRRAEEALRRSERNFRSLADNSLQGIQIYQGQNIVYINQAMADIMGYSYEEQTSMSLEELRATVHPLDRSIADERAHQRREGKEIAPYVELRIVRKDGEVRWLQSYNNPIEFDGKPAILSASLDITERKQAEEAIRQSERILREAEVLGHTGSWEQDLVTGEIFNTEENLRLFFGDDRSKGGPFEDYSNSVHPDDREYVLKRHEELLAGGPPDIEYRVVWPDGSIHVIYGLANVVRDESGKPIRVYGTNVEITERRQAEQALRESESIFRGFLEQSVDAVMLTDEQGMVIQWSRGAEKLTGYSRDGSLGIPLWDVQFRSAPDEFKSSEQHTLIKSTIQAMLSTGQGSSLNKLTEAVLQRPDGTRVAAQTLAFSIDTDKGHLLGSILRDITERKQAEESIRSSEERFRTLYENNTLGLYRTTPDGRILLANPALVKMLGFASADELKDRNLEQAGYEPSYERAQFLETIEAQGQVYGLESSWERKDGSPIFIRESARAVRDPQGKTLYYDGTVEDITERKQAEEALRASEARYKGLFEDSPIALWEEDFSLVKQRLDALKQEGITDFNDYFTTHPEVVAECASLVKVLDVNKTTIKMLGARKKEDLFKGLGNLLKDEPDNGFKNELFNIIKGKTSFGWEGTNKTLDGRLIHIQLSWSAAPGYEDSLAKVIVSMIDITERKQAEDAVHASEDRYKGLFEDSPVALWEEDFSLVKGRLDALKEEGVTDFNEYFTSHPEVTVEFVALIKVLDVNKKTMSLLGAKQKDDILKNLTEIFAGEPIQIFQNELVNIAQGRTRFAWEGMNNTLDGRRINLELIWSAVLGFENSLSRVILSMVDVTERKKAEVALARSEQEYRTLFENMPIGLYRTSANGRILDANRAMVEMFGYKDREAILATNVAELYVDPASDEKFKIEIGKTGIISNFEAEFRRPDGSTFWTEDHNRVIRSESGSPRYYEGSLIDITVRKQAEAERQALTDIMQAAALTDTLQEFLERVRRSLDTVLDAENFFVVFHNKVTGLFEEIFSVDRFDGPMPPSRLEKSISSYVLRTGEPLLLTRARFEELREAGEVELVGASQASWLGAPLNTLNGAIGVIAVQNYEDPDCYSERDRDFLASVTGEVALAIERKRAEETLAEERNLLRTLIDNIPDRVYVKDAQGRKTLANLSEWQASRVKTMEEVIGKNDFDIYPPELAEQYWAIDKAILDSGTPVINLEEPGLDAYSNLVWLLTTKVPLRDGRGKITGLVGIGHDITERKQVEKRIQNQLNHLAALRAIDQVITSSFDLHYNLRWILETLMKELGVDAADILMLNTGFGSLEFSAGIGFRDKAAERASERLDHTYAGRVVLERQLIQVHDLNEQQNDLQLRPQLTGEGFVSYFGVPLMAKGSIKGVLEAFHRGRLEPDQEWIDLLNTLAGQAALAIDNGSMFESLQRSNIDLTLAYDATIEGWSRAMDLRDKETEGHTQRVTKMTLDLAVLFGIKDEDLVSIRRGALLHDIGKMGVPDAILLKPAALTDEEWVIMRKHPALAYEMLAPISYLRAALDIPYCHHEKWDGTGYPRGLKGEQIPLAARIFAIVDVWDALISDRPYRKAWSNEKILEHLKSGSGTHFDPQVVKICLETGVFERK